MGTGKTALITGGSSGIGATFARQLAAQGYDLALVARRRERLAELAGELQQAHDVCVEVLAADLADPAGVEQVEKRLGEIEDLAMLINNAGFGTTGRFAAVDMASQLAMIQVHVVATVRLCRAALPAMLARNQGAIINVSSVTAFIPLPGSVNYSASKAYLVNFSEALQAELIGTGIKVQALCPSFTLTEFHDTPEYAKFNRARVPGFMWMSAEEVVADSLKALKRERVTHVSGLRNRLLIALVNRATIPWLLKLFPKAFTHVMQRRA
jgi:short-subunit dehydrogenase